MGVSCFQHESKNRKKLANDGPDKPKIKSTIKNSKSDIIDVNKEENVKIKKNMKRSNTLGKKTDKTKESPTKNSEIKDTTKNDYKNKINEKKWNKNNKKENKKKQLTRSNIIKAYMPTFAKENNYYIVCPTCQLLFPNITNIDYDKEKKDFRVFYTCKCNTSNKLNKSSMFLDFINKNRPQEKNTNFNQSEVMEQFIKKINKEKNFEGREMLTSAIQNSLDINCAPPPACVNIKESIRNPSLIKSFFPNFKVSQLQPIKEEVEKELKNQTFQNKDQINSQPSFLQKEPEDDIYDFKKYKCIKTFNKTSRVSSLIQLESGALCISYYDNKIYIFDINNNLNEKELKEDGIAICLLEFKPNFLLVGTNENYISLWNLNSHKREYIFEGHTMWVNGLAKCNEEKFASCSNDKNIIIWDFTNKTLVNKISAHNESILTIIKLNNGNLCSGSCDLIIKIWNWETAECLYKYEGFENWIRCICQFDDQTLIVGSDKTITILKNKEIKAILSEHNNDVRNICKIDENYFASASFDNTIKIWNINFLSCEQTLEGHTSNVVNIIKLKGSNSLASCSTDNTIKIWRQN